MAEKKYLHITIPEPCQQSWQTMLPDGQGRFCNHCQKTVVDFTGMSDAEVARIMATPEAPTCGRLLKSQLNRPIILQATYPQRSWPRLAAGAVLLLMAMPHALLAQAPPATATSITTTQSGLPAANPNPAGGDFVLKGHLIDAETGEPIVGATVKIVALGVGAYSDEMGAFAFKVPLGRAGDSLLLQAKLEDAYEAEIFLDKRDMPSEITIALHPSTSVPDISVGFMVTRPLPNNIHMVEQVPEPLFGPRKNKRPSKPSK